MKDQNTKDILLLTLMAALLLLNSNATIIDFNVWTTYVGVMMGWLIGFVQYAALSSSTQCVPQVIYSLESAIVIN